jgi:hypothetical protein
MGLTGPRIGQIAAFAAQTFRPAAFIYCLLKAATFGKTISYAQLAFGRRWHGILDVVNCGKYSGSSGEMVLL